MKKETKIAEELRRSREKVKQLERERDELKRRRIAQERKRIDRLNMLLGRALIVIAKLKTFESIKEHLEKEKTLLIQCVKKKGGKVVEDDTDFRDLMSYLDEVIGSKGQQEGRES